MHVRFADNRQCPDSATSPYLILSTRKDYAWFFLPILSDRSLYKIAQYFHSRTINPKLFSVLHEFKAIKTAFGVTQFSGGVYRRDF